MSSLRIQNQSTVIKVISVDLDKTPDTHLPVQAVCWHHDAASLFHYIIIGCNHNPINNSFEKVIVIHLNLHATRKLFESLTDLNSKLPPLPPVVDNELMSMKSLLVKQLSTLFTGFHTFPCNAIRFSFADGESEMSCFYVSPMSLHLFSQKKIGKVKAEPIVRFSMGTELLVGLIRDANAFKEVTLRQPTVTLLQEKGI